MISRFFDMSCDTRGLKVYLNEKHSKLTCYNSCTLYLDCALVCPVEESIVAQTVSALSLYRYNRGRLDDNVYIDMVPT